MLCEANQRSCEELFKNKGILITFILCADISKIFYYDLLYEIIFKTIIIKNNVFLNVSVQKYFINMICKYYLRKYLSFRILHRPAFPGSLRETFIRKVFASQNIFDAKLLIYLLYKYFQYNWRSQYTTKSCFVKRTQ